jgi:predicted phosphodiesterase
MRKVAVITDIHGNLPALEAALARVDEIGPDPSTAAATWSLGGKRVRLVHGSPRKVNEYLFEDKPAHTFERIAAGADCDVLVFGHTHKPWIATYGDALFVNCGSVGKPKDGDSRGGFAVHRKVGGDPCRGSGTRPKSLRPSGWWTTPLGAPGLI